MSVSKAMPKLLVLLFSVHYGLLYAHESDGVSHSSESETSGRTDASYAKYVNTILIEKLLDWVQMNTQYDISQTRGDPPVIDFCIVGDRIDYEGRQIIVDAG